MKVTYDELIRRPDAPPWEPDQVRIGPKRFTIRRALGQWDEHCYFRLEKKSQKGAPPTLVISVREVNQAKKFPPYRYDSIELPWDVVEKLVEFLSAGPWRRR